MIRILAHQLEHTHPNLYLYGEIWPNDYCDVFSSILDTLQKCFLFLQASNDSARYWVSSKIMRSHFKFFILFCHITNFRVRILDWKHACCYKHHPGAASHWSTCYFGTRLCCCSHAVGVVDTPCFQRAPVGHSKSRQWEFWHRHC